MLWRKVFEAADSGAKVISLSLGAPNGGTALQQAVQYAWNKGSVIVAAAGNAGNTKLITLLITAK